MECIYYVNFVLLILPFSVVSRFPSSDYPVIALMGAPGSFPIKEEHTWLQKYVHWSAKIEKEAKKFITNVLKDEPFLAIHLRNGIDFVSTHSRLMKYMYLHSVARCSYSQDIIVFLVP